MHELKILVKPSKMEDRKENKKLEQVITGLWENFKKLNIHMMGSPKERSERRRPQILNKLWL